MARLDFATITTDDLLPILPPTETNEWEFKAAAVFDKTNFGEFKKQKLGKIVSSFANSGGGFLLLGKQDGAPVFENVPTKEGNTSMEDHLSLVISQCVTPHYRNFSIHRVPIGGRAGESILVMAFDDSPAAPHQSVSDTNYYYRLPGHAVPAPHFHLDLLRNRNTRAVITLDEPTYSISIPFLPLKEHRDKLCLEVDLTFDVHNRSEQIADPYGVRIFSDDPKTLWCAGSLESRLCKGTFIAGKSPLFPTLDEPMNVTLRTLVANSLDINELLAAWNDLAFSMKAVTQNFAGEAKSYRPAQLLVREGEEMVHQAIAQRNEEETRWKQSSERLIEDAKTKFAHVPEMMAKLNRRFD